MKNLKLLIRQVISEHFNQNIVSEADITGHAVKRFYDRFLTEAPKEVGFEKQGTVGEYDIIGTKSLSPEVIAAVKNRFDVVGATNFNPNKSYAIKIADLYIKPETVTFNSEEDKKRSNGKTLLYVDEATSSNGNHIYLIIRGNQAITIFFAKSYAKIGTDKFKVDFIVQDFNKIVNKEIR
jgi:hypothetical protein